MFQRDTPIMKELSWLCPDASLDENKGWRFDISRWRHDLNLSGWGMASLPDTIGGLAALRNIDLTNCSSLTALPNTIGGLCAGDAKIRRVREPHRATGRDRRAKVADGT